MKPVARPDRSVSETHCWHRAADNNLGDNAEDGIALAPAIAATNVMDTRLADCHDRVRLERGFFVPAMILVFLVIIFVALAFGTRLRDSSQPVDFQYSDRYHELIAKEQRSESENAELELEKCKHDRQLLIYLQKKSSAKYGDAKARYENSCSAMLPL